jgi:hypothetical protein
MDRQQAHQLLDQLGPTQLEAVGKLLEVMVHADEEVTGEDRRVITASREYFQHGNQGLSLEEMVAGCGFTMEQIRNHEADQST